MIESKVMKKEESIFDLFIEFLNELRSIDEMLRESEIRPGDVDDLVYYVATHEPKFRPLWKYLTLETTDEIESLMKERI